MLSPMNPIRTYVATRLGGKTMPLAEAAGWLLHLRVVFEAEVDMRLYFLSCMNKDNDLRI
jgi:hypothetical protein